MGLEPTTPTLATWRSTTELHPPIAGWKDGKPIGFPIPISHYKGGVAISRDHKRSETPSRHGPVPGSVAAPTYRDQSTEDGDLETRAAKQRGFFMSAEPLCTRGRQRRGAGRRNPFAR